jgi:hypothetical protein
VPLEGLTPLKPVQSGLSFETPSKKVRYFGQKFEFFDIPLKNTVVLPNLHIKIYASLKFWTLVLATPLPTLAPRAPMRPSALSSFPCRPLQVVRREAHSLIFKLKNHFKSFWNLLDLVIFLLFVVAIILRLQPDPDVYARVIYAINLMFSYLRFMENFYVSKMIGPKIIMIQRMVLLRLYYQFI